MTESRKFLLWAPRLILSAFALFQVLFSFDVFGEGKSAVQIAIDFVLHNIPSKALGLVVCVSWRREWIGALACAALAIAYIAWAWGRFPPTVYVFIAGPLFLVSVLYAVNWRLRKRATRSRTGPAKA